MIVAITGASGFIGKKLLARCLDDGHTVRVLTRRGAAGFSPKVTVINGDLAGYIPESLVNDVDVLFHCAAETRDTGSMRAVNIEGTANLARVATGRIGRWVQLSSAGAYGPWRSGTVTEETEERPAGPYECSKADADTLIRQVAAGGAFECSILRPTIVFGAGMANRSVFQLISVIDRGRFAFVGPPGASANYVHADNVIDALCLCATEPAASGRTYNLSNQGDMEGFVGAIAQALGKPLPRWRLPQAPALLVAKLLSWIPGFPVTESQLRALTNRARYPSARIERELGYRHRVSMEAGLAELVCEWMRQR